MGTSGYAAFISYRHQSPDQELAKALHTVIETYRIPSAVKKQTGRKNMGKVFRDQEELPLSADLGADIEAALDGSEWFIAICSPRYLESRWCLREMEYFIGRKGRARVLTVLAEGEPDGSFPDMLRFAENEAGERVETEPLAADVRGADLKACLKKLKREKLRVFAPMLGLRFDDLKRRARQRKIRIGLLIAAIALIAAAGVSAFLIASHAKSEAFKREAAEQAQIAERERGNALKNRVGEWLEKAASARADGKPREAAAALSSALADSDACGGFRRDEILAAMRGVVCTEPYMPVMRFVSTQGRMSEARLSSDGTAVFGILGGVSAAKLDLASGDFAWIGPDGGGTLSGLCVSADGTRVAAIGNQGGAAYIWDGRTGAPVMTYTGERPEGIKNLAFLADNALLMQDGDRFLLVSDDGTAQPFYALGEQQDGYSAENNLYKQVLNTTASAALASHAALSAPAPCVSADGTRVLIAGDDGSTGTIVLDGNGQRVCLLEGMPGTPLEKYALSADGRYAACVSELGFFAVWSAESGRLLQGANVNASALKTCSAPAFSPDGSKIAFICSDTLWVFTFLPQSLTDYELDRSLDQTPFVSYGADGLLLLTNGQLYIADADTLSLLHGEQADRNTAFVRAEACGQTVAAFGGDGSVTLCLKEEYAAIRTVGKWDGGYAERYDPRENAGPASDFGCLYGEQNGLPLPYVFLSRDGGYAALSYRDGTIELYETDAPDRAAAVISQLDGYAAAIGITGDRMVAADEKGRLLFYDIKDGAIVALRTESFSYRTLAFDPNGVYVLAKRAGGDAFDVFDVRTGALIVSKAAEGVDTLSFSEDGRYALVGTADGTIVLELFADETTLIEQVARLSSLYLDSEG